MKRKCESSVYFFLEKIEVLATTGKPEISASNICNTVSFLRTEVNLLLIGAPKYT